MRYSIEGKILADIADAINAKTGGTAALAPGDMADEIDSISGGGAVAELGPIWSEFTSTVSASNAQTVFDSFFPTAQSGDTFIAICQKLEKDFVNNQLVYGLFLKGFDGNVDVVLFVRYRDGLYDAQKAYGASAYDLSVSAGDKFIICEVT